jgi:thioredoxin-related protein
VISPLDIPALSPMLHAMTPLNRFTACAAIVALFAPFAAADEAWTMDYAAAKTAAAEGSKDLFLEFTGSDWCPPCKMLNQEVFSKEEFVKGAKEHFVLVKLDFPRDDSKLSDEVKAQNEELSEKYAIEGYPTILLCDAQGRPYAATGYQEGGPEAYLKHLEELRSKRVERDAAFKTAGESEGVAKAKSLLAAIEAMGLEPGVVAKFYGEVVEEIKKNDPQDETGMVKKAALQEKLDAFDGKINERAQGGDFEGILPLVDEMLKTEGLSPDQIQEVTLTRALVFAQLGRFDEALAVIDEAAKIAPDSEITPHLEGFKAQLTQARDAAKGGNPEGEKPEE